jgi:hypothetical protein
MATNGYTPGFDISRMTQSQPAPTPAITPASSPAPSGPLVYNNAYATAGGPLGATASSVAALSFTTSSYGKPIPIVYGAAKISGNVLWSAPAKTSTFIGSDGKSYSYVASSFAIAICEGQIGNILNIWSGDALIYTKKAIVDGSAVLQPVNGALPALTIDTTSSSSPLRAMPSSLRLTTIRVYTGTETQIPDQAIIKQEGIISAPAYRGIAYVVFENFITSNGTIPDIMFEVSSTVTELVPRLYGTLPVPEVKFDDIQHRATNLIYDPSYNVFHAGVEDISGGGTIAHDYGSAIWAGDSLELLKTVPSAENGSEYFYDYDYRFLCPASGRLLLANNTARRLTVYHAMLGKSEKRNSFSASTTFTGGFYLPPVTEGACVFPTFYNGTWADIFCTFSTSTGSMGLYWIEPGGSAIMIKALDGAFTTSMQTPAAIYFNVPTSFQAAYRRFSDGASTSGSFLFAFYTTGSTSDSIQCKRFQLSDSAASYVANPIIKDVGAIIDSNAYLGGYGFPIQLRKVALDTTDGCFVLFISQTSRSDYIVKWNPFTNSVMWRTAASFRSDQFGPNNNIIIPGGTYAFVDASNSVQRVNLITGELTTVIASLAAQSLPTPSTVQIYNGFEDSIAYGTYSTPTKTLSKLFLGRNDSNTVPVSSVVSSLLKRVGVNPVDILISDVSVLTTRGYSVTSPATLRSIFSELAQVFSFDVIESSGYIVYRARGSSSIKTIDGQFLNRNTTEGWLAEKQDDPLARTRKLALSYTDVDRGYTSNVQSIILPNINRDRIDDEGFIDVSVNLALKANEAQRLAESLIFAKQVYATSYEGLLPPRFLDLDPGDVVTLALDDGDVTARLRAVEIGTDKSVKITASREDPDIYNDTVALFGNVGRYDDSLIPTPDPRVDVLFLQMPYRSDTEASLTTDSYRLYFTVLPLINTDPVDKELVFNINGEEVVSAEAPATFPTWGRCSVVSPYTVGVNTPSPYRTDRITTITLTVAHENSDFPMPVGTVDKNTLLSNPHINLAYISGSVVGTNIENGGELIQFETCTHVSGNVYTLTGLHRGLYGTEATVLNHSPTDTFVLLGDVNGNLDESSVVPLYAPVGTSRGKGVVVTFGTTNPYQSAHVQAVYALNLRQRYIGKFKAVLGGGNITMTWERSTRFGGDDALADGAENVPLNSPTESYTLYLCKGTGSSFNINDPSTYMRSTTAGADRTFVYTSAMQSADGFAPAVHQLTVFIWQTGGYTTNDDGPHSREWTLKG